jgi:hypothetical protein
MSKEARVIKKCIYCGSEQIGIGYQQGSASMLTNQSGFSGSMVIHEICTDCGSILYSKVKSPEKFK